MLLFSDVQGYTCFQKLSTLCFFFLGRTSDLFWLFFNKPVVCIHTCNSRKSVCSRELHPSWCGVTYYVNSSSEKLHERQRHKTKKVCRKPVIELPQSRGTQGTTELTCHPSSSSPALPPAPSAAAASPAAVVPEKKKKGDRDREEIPRRSRWMAVFGRRATYQSTLRRPVSISCSSVPHSLLLCSRC